MLSIYCTNIAFYLYLRSTCNTRAELNGIKTHPVLSLIANFKELIEKLESNLNGMPEMTEMVNFLLESQEIPKIQDDRSSIQDQSEEEQDLPIESEESQEESEQEVVEIVQKKKSKKQVIQPFIIQSTAPINYKKQTVSDDFCDALEINDVDLDDKKKRKKSLQFQVAKVNKVAENKRMRLMASGGDDDIPFLDKFGRIESEKKDKVLKKPDLEQDQLDNDLDMDFGVESEQEDQTPVHKFNPDEEEALEFYNSIKQAKKQKKIDRQVAHESQPTLDEILIAEENEESLDISKRPANWQILKNKGLTPYRKKENRNPRVKRRNRYESAMKKLNTVKKSAVDRSKMSSYGGEVTGIKTHLSRSTRLS